MDKQSVLQEVVEGCSRDTMGSGRGRKELAVELSERLGLWQQPLMEFVSDMRGLNFRYREDRQTFILFFRHAYALDVV